MKEKAKCSRGFRARFKNINLGLMINLTLTIVSCDLGQPQDKINSIELNPKLKRALYWGYKDPQNYLPNEGSPVNSDIRYPIWLNAKKVLVYSGTVENGVARKGIFEIMIDETTKAFKSYTVFEFSNNIASLGYDPNRNEVFIVYAVGSSYSGAYVTLSSNQVTINEEIVGTDWNPWGITNWSGKPGLVFYGQSPSSGTKGFFWRYRDVNNVTKDSLLYSISLNQNVAQSFSISSDGKYLFFGTQIILNQVVQTEFSRLDISSANQNPVIILEAQGSFLGVRANPVNPELILMNYSFGGDAINPPQAHIVLLNQSSLQSRDLNVRTYTSTLRFISNENPYWSTDGKHFAFSAGGADGEGGRYQLELWIYENVP